MLDLVEILKDCPKGTKLYSTIYGDVFFEGIIDLAYPIQISNKNIGVVTLSEKGRMIIGVGECILFPSRDQRDWSKFTAPWYKKERFDPKTLQPFDKILVKRYDDVWVASLLSYCNEIRTDESSISYLEFITISNGTYRQCIPYNDDTKHLVGKVEEAPEYYRYWEN